MGTPVIAYPGFHTLTKILKEYPKQKEKFEARLHQNTWEPYDTRFVGPWKYNKEKDIVAVELFGENAIKLNLQNWMIKEALGIGAGHYSVFVHRGPAFNSKLKLLLSCLPLEKMTFYPVSTPLCGEFLEDPWLSKVQPIIAQPPLTYQEFHNAFCLPAP